ncbi:hypothetical protein ABZP36_014049 [Zizania latifolia]
MKEKFWLGETPPFQAAMSILLRNGSERAIVREGREEKFMVEFLALYLLWRNGGNVNKSTRQLGFCTYLTLDFFPVLEAVASCVIIQTNCKVYSKNLLSNYILF